MPKATRRKLVDLATAPRLPGSPPNKKQKTSHSPKCKFSCNRTVNPGLTRNGNNFDTCCRDCAVLSYNSSKEDRLNPNNHSYICNSRNQISNNVIDKSDDEDENNQNVVEVKDIDNYKFDLVAIKGRINAREEISSIKRILVVKKLNENKEYYYRIWSGFWDNENINDYILLHKLKLVSNQNELKDYIKNFKYGEHNDTKMEINDTIVPNLPREYSLIKKKCIELIENKIDESNCNPIYSKENILPSPTYQNHIKRNPFWNEKNVNYDSLLLVNKSLNICLSQKLLNSYPLSELDTNNDENLSVCSGDTTFDLQDGIVKELQNNFRKSTLTNNKNIIASFYDYDEEKYPRVEEELESLGGDIFRQHLVMQKLLKAFQQQDFINLYIKTDWKDQSKDIIESIRNCGIVKLLNISIPNDVIEIILNMVIIFPTTDELQNRRIEFWQQKVSDWKENESVGERAYYEALEKCEKEYNKENS